MINNVPINGNDIVIANIVSKQEYIQNKIKYDAKFFIKELFNKIFLIKKEYKSKVIFTNYLFSVKEITNKKSGVVIFCDFQPQKTIIILGTLENPLDSKSLLKLEYMRDKFYENNVLTFSNWIKFFASVENNIYVITNSTKKFKELSIEQKLDNYKFSYIDKDTITKINNSLKPFYTKDDLLSIYIPSLIVLVVFYFLINISGDIIIENDIKSSKKTQEEKTLELTQKTEQLQDLKNNDLYKNKDYYSKLVERKVYIRNKHD